MKLIQFHNNAIISHRLLAVVGLLLASLGSLFASSVTLTWDASTGTNVTGYKLCYGPASCSYTNSLSFGTVTEATVDSLVSGASYYFAAKAVTASGTESAFSNELFYQVPGIVVTNYVVILSNLNQTYDGTGKSIAATTVPPGGSVLITYNGATTPPVAAGSYGVVASISSTNGTGSTTNTLVISKAPAAVLIASLNQTFDGLRKPVTIDTMPIGLPFTVTYNGSSVPPTNAGTYSVTAIVNDPNYVGGATSQLVISKANVVVSMMGLSQLYDGTPRIVTAAAQPASLTPTITYEGASSPPTNAGSYSVVAMVNNPNYFGAATNTLCVAKSQATVSVTNLSQVYDGTAKAVSVLTQPANLSVVVTYDGLASAPTNSATYAVICTVNDTNYCGSFTNALVIRKASATVTLANLSQVYNGAPKSVTVTTQPAGLAVQTSYNGTPSAPIAAGTFAVTTSVISSNYCGVGTNIMTIKKASASIVLANTTQTFDGTAKPVSVITTPSGLRYLLLYNGNYSAPTNAGTYQVFVFVQDPNYDASIASSLVIRPSPTTISLAPLAQAYDGTPRVVTAATQPIGVPVSIKYNGSSTAPTAVGNYTVVASVASANYSGAVTNALVVTNGPSRNSLVKNSPPSLGKNSEPQLVLQWEATTDSVTIYHSTDLFNWEALRNEPDSPNTLVLPSLAGAHFFRATGTADTGTRVIPLTITPAK